MTARAIGAAVAPPVPDWFWSTTAIASSAGLSHPNIVSIFDRGEFDGSYFIVMEYVEGRTLKELIRSRGLCPVPVPIAYTRQILAALRYAHRNGVIHRDI